MKWREWVGEDPEGSSLGGDAMGVGGALRGGAVRRDGVGDRDGVGGDEM
jgi:hypothetical protein